MDLMSDYVSEQIQIVTLIVSIPGNHQTQGSHTHDQGSERKAYRLQTQIQSPMGLKDPQR